MIIIHPKIIFPSDVLFPQDQNVGYRGELWGMGGGKVRKDIKNEGWEVVEVGGNKGWGSLEIFVK